MCKRNVRSWKNECASTTMMTTPMCYNLRYTKRQTVYVQIKRFSIVSLSLSLNTLIVHSAQCAFIHSSTASQMDVLNWSLSLFPFCIPIDKVNVLAEHQPEAEFHAIENPSRICALRLPNIRMECQEQSYILGCNETRALDAHLVWIRGKMKGIVIKCRFH